MTLHHVRPLAIAVLFVALAATIDARPFTDTSIRVLDAPLTAVVDAGRRRSQTFRALLERLGRGDVVVYLQYARLPAGIHGRLIFLTAAAGRRYVLVEVARELDAARLIAIVGHELRHAVEILEQPAIVDRATFAHAYERAGFRRRRFADGGIGFDTAAAVLAGRQVLRELVGSALTLATR